MLRISLLGPPDIGIDDERRDLPGYRPMALLAYLLLTEKAHSREHLVDLLFERPDDPRAALRWTLTKLRKELGSDYIIADRKTVAFNFDGDYWLDVHAFEGGDLDRYRGELLEGLQVRDARSYEHWLLVQRESYKAKYQEGLEAHLETEKEAGNAAVVEETAAKLLALDNLREDWHRELMGVFAQQGKFEAALAQYELCRNILREELNLEPDPKTIDLAEAIRAEQTAVYKAVASRPNGSFLSPTTVDYPAEDSAPLNEERTSSSEIKEEQPRSSKRVLLGAFIVLGLLLLAAGLWAFFPASPTDDQVEAEEATGDFSGTTVKIGGPNLGTESYEQSVVQFEQETGIDIEFIDYGADFEVVLDDVIMSGLIPDIIQFPQPGYLFDFVRQGEVIDVRTFLSEEYLQQQYNQALLDAMMVDGHMAGIWHTSNVKSLVWYPKKSFDAAGYQVPESWDEMMQLSDQIAADGTTPWCISINSGEATGWVGTDWLEDILLRTAPLEVYDAWVAGELPFDSPEIRRAWGIMSEIWMNERYTYGAAETIISEQFNENPMHMFSKPPECYLHRQGSFITSYFPEDSQFGVDYDFFFLPPIDEEFGNPVLGAGDIMAMFNDRPEVRETMKYFTEGKSIRPGIENGVVIAPHRDVPFEWYNSPVNLKIAQVLLEADSYRFDGSDMMPGVVGAGSFWKGVADWVEGEELDTVLREIDESWPEETGN